MFLCAIQNYRWKKKKNEVAQNWAQFDVRFPPIRDGLRLTCLLLCSLVCIKRDICNVGIGMERPMEYGETREAQFDRHQSSCAFEKARRSTDIDYIYLSNDTTFGLSNTEVFEKFCLQKWSPRGCLHQFYLRRSCSKISIDNLSTFHARFCGS